jgi:hypothetical protein
LLAGFFSLAGVAGGLARRLKTPGMDALLQLDRAPLAP